MTPLDILVLGGSGQVGTAIRALALPEGIRIHAPSRADLDLTAPRSVRAALAARSYGAVINAAAYTAVDRAETEIGQAWALNAIGPAILAAETAKAGLPLVHVSTDYVFDGLDVRAREPGDPVNPVGVYGASKAAGELAVRAGHPRHAIVRTAWVVSPYRTNFVKTILRLSAERDRLSVVDDQHGSPTSAADLAAALVRIARRLSDDGASAGTHHCVNAGETTWCGLARAVVEGAARRGRRSVPVEPIATSAFPTPARRPPHSTLSTASLAATFGIVMRPWTEAVDDIVDALIGPSTQGSVAR